MQTIRISILASIIALGSISLANAAPRGSVGRANAFAARNNLQTRTVTRRVGNRNIRRVFVPIIAGQEHDFLKSVIGGNSASVALVARPASNHPVGWNHYVRLALSPKKVYASYYDNVSGPKVAENQTQRALKWESGGRYVVLDVGRKARTGMAQFLTTFHRSSSYSSDKRNYCEVRGDRAGDVSADCMWWLTNVEPAPSTNPGGNLMQFLKVKRTRGPQEMPAIAMHAATSKHVKVIGVAVRNQTEFNRMSEAKLFGNEPTNGGAAGSVR